MYVSHLKRGNLPSPVRTTRKAPFSASWHTIWNDTVSIDVLPQSLVTEKVFIVEAAPFVKGPYPAVDAS
jgi:hypothetical protein